MPRVPPEPPAPAELVLVRDEVHVHLWTEGDFSFVQPLYAIEIGGAERLALASMLLRVRRFAVRRLADRTVFAAVGWDIN